MLHSTDMSEPSLAFKRWNLCVHPRHVECIHRIVSIPYLTTFGMLHSAFTFFHKRRHSASYPQTTLTSSTDWVHELRFLVQPDKLLPNPSSAQEVIARFISEHMNASAGAVSEVHCRQPHPRRGLVSLPLSCDDIHRFLIHALIMVFLIYGRLTRRLNQVLFHLGSTTISSFASEVAWTCSVRMKLFHPDFVQDFLHLPQY